MPSSTPFVDPDTGALDTAQLRFEAVPLAKLVGLVALVALVPFAAAFLVGPYSSLTPAFVVVGQFVLAVGAGLVLLYVDARGIQLSGD